VIVHRGIGAWLAAKTNLGGKADLGGSTAGGALGFVPTMGNLHAGHAALLARARQDCGTVLLSIFVNPTQFDDPTDLERYPRTLESDLAVAQAAGVDHVLLPTPAELYPDGYTYKVQETAVSTVLCGAARPGHFDGVLSVVMKLLQLAQLGPDATRQRLYMGEKDHQQLTLVRGMVEAFFLPWTVVGCPTVRESDGLAMSSRNSRLTAAQRQLAPQLARALREAPDPAAARATLEAAGFRIDYLEDRALGAAPAVAPRRYVAAFLGDVRLIDNVALD
jgi:pantoate--beta-alanine ligase